MVTKKDLLIISNLRQDARMNLTKMSRNTRIPISTIFDKIKSYNGNIVRKHVALIDFEKLGYNTRAKIILKVNKEDKVALKNYLVKDFNVNSVYRINNGYDFMIETIFQNIKAMEEFLEKLEERFRIEQKEYFYIIDDLKRESFLSNAKELTSVFLDVR
ncbi:MAG: Lrp/AsnC family transcriptional regulator [Nanoarchaeota archaeon]|nr:Lrp/AsnC family transcriptional regulator [Nanoarchaeota archaeon]